MKNVIDKTYVRRFVASLILSSLFLLTVAASAIDATTKWGDVNPKNNTVQGAVDAATAKTCAMFIIPMTGHDGRVYPHFELKATVGNFGVGGTVYYCMSSLNRDNTYASDSEFYCDWASIYTTGGYAPWVFPWSGWSGTNIQEFDPRAYHPVDDTLRVRDSVYDTWNNGVIYGGVMEVYYEYPDGWSEYFEERYTDISGNDGYFIPRSDITDDYEKHLPRYYIVFVEQSDCRRRGGSWLSNNNEELTWRFIRYGDAGLERSYTSSSAVTVPDVVRCYYDEDGDLTDVTVESLKEVVFNESGDEFQAWNPIEPVRWFYSKPPLESN